MWKPLGIEVNERHQLFEMFAEFRVDRIGREFPEQSGNEYARGRHTNGDPDGSANDQPCPEAPKE